MALPADIIDRGSRGLTPGAEVGVRLSNGTHRALVVGRCAGGNDYTIALRLGVAPDELPDMLLRAADGNPITIF